MKIWKLENLKNMIIWKLKVIWKIENLKIWKFNENLSEYQSWLEQSR